MEKAHPEIQDYFLQVFDKGESQDSRGRKVDFRSYLFVMTCNVTRNELRRPIGFAATTDKAAENAPPRDDLDLSHHFHREFLARVRQVFQFRAFDRKDYFEFLERRLATLAGDIDQKYSVGVQIAEAAKSQFADLCIAQPDGYRGFDRLFDRLIVVPVVKQIGSLPQGEILRLVRFGNGRPEFG
jgi:ATP-dependent Clp protease ATP-binding subunit ClpA